MADSTFNIVFGFGFTAPWFLWGLGFAAAPIIIHFLSRRRYQIAEWAAMEWLLAALRKQRHRIRLEQIVLLLIRSLLIVSVVLAVARPYLRGTAAALAAGTRTHSIIVLDTSFSMSYHKTNSSRLDRAKRIAGKLLEASRRADAASLILMARPASAVISHASTNVRAVKEAIERTKPAHTPADLFGTFELLKTVIESSPYDRIHVYLISDLQRSTWQPAAANASALRQAARAIAEKANVTVIDTGNDGTDNVAVTELSLLTPLAITSQPCQLRATAHNFGQRDIQNGLVKLLLDDVTRQSKTIDIPAGEQTSVVFSTVFSSGGQPAARVEFSDDALKLDNKRWLALDVREHLDVLLIDGEPSGRAFESETDYLKAALAPESGDRPVTPFRPTASTESGLLEENLTDFDCVVLANVAQLTEQEYKVLQRYLHLGGSLVWFFGDQVDIDSYNRVLWRNGKGVLPVKLLKGVDAGGPSGTGTTFDPLGYRHPIVRPFEGVERAGLLTARILKYIKVQPSKDRNVQTALAYATGDPAIVTSRAFNGTVAIVTTAADTEWSSWPVRYSYVPVLNELFTYVIRAKSGDHNVEVGGSAAVSLLPSATPTTVSVQMPSGNPFVRTVPAGKGIRLFRLDRLLEAGPYSVTIGPPAAKSILFAANVDTRESDLSRISPDLLKELFSGGQVNYMTGDELAQPDELGARTRQASSHRPLLYAAVVLLFLDSLLAWLFGRHGK